ncbi:DUF3221 domain-containing protein [Virgibacillus kimchii]
MIKKILFIALIISIVGACTQQEQESRNDDLEEHEGIIAKIERAGPAEHVHEGRYSMLLISEAEAADISNKTEEELVKLAQNNGGSYYGVNPAMHDELGLDIGTKVIVYWNGSQGDSDPPVRDAEKIEIIPNK